MTRDATIVTKRVRVDPTRRRETRKRMKTKILALILSLTLPTVSSRGDVVIDNFNASRTYAACCGEYGTYDSFTNNVTQNGGGTLAISGAATEGGGLYREGFGNSLWNFLGPTNLGLTLRSLPGNTTTNLNVSFRDLWGGAILFTFSWNTLGSNSFTNITKTLHSPDWTNAQPFEYGYVKSVDLFGSYGTANSTLRLELDSLSAIGPVLTFGPAIEILRDGNNVTLRWPTNGSQGFNLQSATNVTGPWTNESSPVQTGMVYQATYASTNGDKFFRLMKSDGSGFSFSLSQDTYGATEPLKDVTSQKPMDYAESLATQKQVGPPATSVGFSNYIDIASYSGWSSNTEFEVFYSEVEIDVQTAFAFNFSDHSGGTASFNFFQCDLHTADPNPPHKWIRQTNHTFTYLETFSPTSNNWPGGWRTESGYAPLTGSAGANRQVERPFVPYAQIQNLGYFHTYGYTNQHTTPPPGWMRSLYRQDDTRLHLHTGLLESNQIAKFVLLSVSATYASGLDFPEDAWPENSSVAVSTTSGSIAFSNITCLQNVPNADSKMFLALSPSRADDATPSVTPNTNFFFGVSVLDHHYVELTRSYHPLFDKPPANTPRLSILKLLYHQGSLILGTDHDAKIPDGDPSVAESTNASSLYRNDDAPAYVEFRIFDGPLTTNVYTRDLRPVFPSPWNNQKYYNIESPTDAQNLLGNANSNIKQVNSIDINGQQYAGLTFAGVRSTLLSEMANAVTVIHEFGHSCGLEHRDFTNALGQLVNPGSLGNAVMDGTNYMSNVEINRVERDAINDAIQNDPLAQ